MSYSFLFSLTDIANRDTYTIDVPSKKDVFDVYSMEMEARNEPVASLRLFYCIWKELFPHVEVAKYCNVCGTCDTCAELTGKVLYCSVCDIP